MASDGLSNMEFRASRVQNDQDVLVSLPMYAIMAGVSVNEINYEDFSIRVKKEYVNVDDLRKLNEDFAAYMSKMESLVPEEDNTYKNFFNFDYWLKGNEEHFKNNGKQLDSIFSVIVLISMGLCFFSLASSVSANIYD